MVYIEVTYVPEQIEMGVFYQTTSGTLEIFISSSPFS